MLLANVKQKEIVLTNKKNVYRKPRDISLSEEVWKWFLCNLVQDKGRPTDATSHRAPGGQPAQ